MINTTTAREQILLSIRDLEKRNLRLSVDDYAADIINVACRYFIQSTSIMKTSDSPMVYYSYNYRVMNNDVRLFVSSVKGYYPFLNDTAVQSLTENICLNLGWNGMPGFLEDYFYKKHGQGSTQCERIDFFSDNHTRYENNHYVNSSEVDRQISLVFTNNRRSLAVSITPSLSRKEASFLRKEGKDLYYVGTDPDYSFVVRINENDEVELFILILKSKSLKIEYR